MNKITMILALAILALGLGMSKQVAAQHLDGAYLTDDNYGGDGDTVIGEVVAQGEAYDKAKALAVAIQRGDKDGDLRAAQQACVDTASRSWIQANYLAEMGRMSFKAGNTEQAIGDYQAALKAAKKAQSVNCHVEEKTNESHEQGRIIERVIRRQLGRLGVK